MSKSTIEGRRCDIGDFTTFAEWVDKYGSHPAACRAIVDGTLEKDFDTESANSLSSRFYSVSTHKDYLLIDLLTELRDLLKAKNARDTLS